MLCGMSSLSFHSLTATTTFFAFAVGVIKLLDRKNGSIPPSANTHFDAATVLILQIRLLLYRYIIPAMTPTKWYQFVSSFIIAVHSAFGLALSGMLQPSKILNFLVLPFSSDFDPSLLFVAIGGLLPNILAWVTHIRSAEKPLFMSRFDFRLNDDIDRKLIVGGAIFGFGWGW